MHSEEGKNASFLSKLSSTACWSWEKGVMQNSSELEANLAQDANQSHYALPTETIESDHLKYSLLVEAINLIVET